MEHQAQQVIAGHAVLGTCRLMANRGKDRFDRVGRADVYPMLGGKVLKSQYRFTDFLQHAPVLGLKFAQERIEDFIGFRPPDFFQPRLALPWIESDSAANTFRSYAPSNVDDVSSAKLR